MVRITLSTRKPLETQAAAYFEAAKKAKRKLDGTRATIARFEAELPAVSAKATKPLRQKQWFERFRWMRTSTGALVIAGRDAGSNEGIIKKHAEKGDFVFHTDLPGSPFAVLKARDAASGAVLASASDDSLEFARAAGEAAQFCAAYGRAWKRGAATADVFWVHPEQLSKTPQSGEFIGRGSFIVRGEKHFLAPKIEIALGVIADLPQSGVPASFDVAIGDYAILAPGEEKPSDLAKKIVKKIGGTPDDWVPIIPAGGARIIAWRKRSRGSREESAPGDVVVAETGFEAGAEAGKENQ